MIMPDPHQALREGGMDTSRGPTQVPDEKVPPTPPCPCPHHPLFAEARQPKTPPPRRCPDFPAVRLLRSARARCLNVVDMRAGEKHHVSAARAASAPAFLLGGGRAARRTGPARPVLFFLASWGPRRCRERGTAHGPVPGGPPLARRRAPRAALLAQPVGAALSRLARGTRSCCGACPRSLGSIFNQF